MSSECDRAEPLRVQLIVQQTHWCRVVMVAPSPRARAASRMFWFPGWMLAIDGVCDEDIMPIGDEPKRIRDDLAALSPRARP